MANYRQDRINDQMVKEIANILREVKDPRITQSLISITAVDVTHDLKFAKIYFSSLQSDKADTKRGLISASGFIRKQIAERLNLRITPELSFIADDSMEYGANITKLLRQVETQVETNDDKNT